MKPAIKFKADIHKTGSTNADVLKLVASHNEGASILAIEDFISFAICHKALFPYTHSGFSITRDEDEPTLFRVSEDDDKTFTLTIEQVEIFELANESDLALYHAQKDPDDIKDIL